jgi:hypothetical protein
LFHNLGYLVTIKARNIQGRGLYFSVVNKNSKRNNLVTYFPENRELKTYDFIIPPGEEYGQGYSLHFDNISIGRGETINDLGRITIDPIPYRFLTEIKLVKKDSLIPANNGGDQRVQVEHPNPSFYKVVLGGVGDTGKTLILSQAYHSGWVAWQGIPLLTKPLEHVMVNNWENGWALRQGYAPQRESIYVFFWPQILEYFGFLGGLGMLGWLVFKKN